MDVPGQLVEEIRRGRCVAFIGAGFSAPTVPTWGALLKQLADDAGLERRTRDRVVALTRRRTARAMEAAAQLIVDHLAQGGSDKPALADLLTRHFEDVPLDPVNERRQQLLRSIPFQAIVTTNFDPLLPGGMRAEPKAYTEVLRAPGRPWWDDTFWDGSTPADPPLVRLHGTAADAASLVLTQQDYRRLLYGDPAYQSFLRSLMATRTILYLGFSFTDAYINLLRSEVLAMLSGDGDVACTAYAVIPDLADEERHLLSTQEGLEAFTYSTTTGHEGFDDFLAALAREAGTQAQLTRTLRDRRILWVDADQDSVDKGVHVLESAMATTDGVVVRASSVAAAMDHLAAQQFDLVITHWGHGMSTRRSSVALELLSDLRSADDVCPAPVIVFASGAHVQDNRLAALRAGATDYVWTWSALFHEVDRVLANPAH